MYYRSFACNMFGDIGEKVWGVEVKVEDNPNWSFCLGSELLVLRYTPRLNIRHHWQIYYVIRCFYLRCLFLCIFKCMYRINVRMTNIQLCPFLVTMSPFYSKEMPVLLPWGGSVSLRSKELKYNFQYFNFLNYSK